MWMSVFLIMEAVSIHVTTQLGLISASVFWDIAWPMTDTPASVG